MPNRLGELDLEEAAKEAAGNWARWDSFAWFRDSELERPEDWFIYYGHHRESGLLDQSNSAQISKALKPFIDADAPNVIEEDHVMLLRTWTIKAAGPMKATFEMPSMHLATKRSKLPAELGTC
ncbi:MAG: hypothetical protein R3C59_21110 [Planctomycetaceae bacterium]